MDPAKAVSGIFLHFNPGEQKAINQGLIDLGYAPDMDGLKAFILESLDGEPEPEDPAGKRGSADRVINQVRDFVRENPDTVRLYGNLARNLANRFLQRHKPAR